jgi:hypothetical protein
VDLKKTESVRQIDDMCREVIQIANHINATTSNAASGYDTINPTQPLSGGPGQAPRRVLIQQLASAAGGNAYADALREFFELDPRATAAITTPLHGAS